MSYDIMILKFNGQPPASPEEIQEQSLTPLGSPAEVRRQISTVLNQTNWSDPTWGTFEGDGFSIEFNVADDDPINNIMLHLRGGGDAISTVANLVSQLGWAAIDCQTNEFLDPKSPSQEGWTHWQSFRDKVARNLEAADDE